MCPLSVKLYAPGHGPIVRHSRSRLSHDYRQWSSAAGQGHECGADLCPAYGNTATLAQALAASITKAGVGVESINCEFTEPDEIQAAVEKFKRGQGPGATPCLKADCALGTNFSSFSTDESKARKRARQRVRELGSSSPLTPDP